MKITYLGHSCFLVETRQAKLIIDPFLTENPAATLSHDDMLVFIQSRRQR